MKSQQGREKRVPYESIQIRVPAPLARWVLEKLVGEYKPYIVEQYRNAMKGGSIMLERDPEGWLKKLTEQWIERHEMVNIQNIVVSSSVDPEWDEFLNNPAHSRIPRDYLEYVYRRGVDNYDPDQYWCPLQRKVIVWNSRGYYKLCGLHEVNEFRTPTQLDLEEFERGYSRLGFPIRNASSRPHAIKEVAYDKEREDRLLAQYIKGILSNPDDPLHEDAKSGALEAKYGISLADYPNVQPLVQRTRPSHKPQGFSLLGADSQTLLSMLDTN